MVRFKLLPDGGFVCGDTVTRRTSYAYPTSAHACDAVRRGAFVAGLMVSQANAFVGCDTTDYDARMWARLGEVV